MRRLWAAGVVVAALGAAADADAQVSLASLTGQATVHVGVANGRDGRGSTLSIGGSMAAIEARGWGAEVDAGVASDNDGRDGGLDVQSYMVNLVGMLPSGRVQPYGTVGAGILRIRACLDTCARTEAWTDWGFSAGGGVQVPLLPSFAVRGEARYFTALGDHPDTARPRDYRFWRISVGGTFLWSID